MIRIIRPTNTRDQFGDGADYKGSRWEVYKTSSKEVKSGKAGAEQMFHILNAPEELLEDWERSIAQEFRALDNYSLSVGDIVELDGEQFLCESFGWKELEAPCNEVDYNREYAM
tara:strand:+ start:333 stop:674 length:342 start_codon:yes stop_codon:yes gene_type:complete